MTDVLSLTKKLIAFNTVNPPGNEADMAKYVGSLIAKKGFEVKYPVFEENRLHLVAEKGVTPDVAPIVFSGHFDTVPLGTKEWHTDPFEGKIEDGKIFGRGSSDMKGGLAAIICAAVQAFEEGSPQRGVRLIFTAGEELGCQGIQQLIKTNPDLGQAAAVVIGEPTANLPAIGHKGGLYLNIITRGVTAHSSMPHLGDNAIYKAAKAISVIENFPFEAEKDPLLGFPTKNVGTMHGGMNLNSVPDSAEFTIDIRSTTKVNHTAVLKKLHALLGADVQIKTLVDLPPVSTSQDHPFVQQVYEICNVTPRDETFPKALPYLTDGSVLQPFYNGAPTIILGPGQPDMAHQTDEFCYVRDIWRAVDVYKSIILEC